MTDLERRILEHIIVHDTRKRDLLRRFQSSDFPAAYQSLLDMGLIWEEGSGQTKDPKLVHASQEIPKPIDLSNVLPFVTRIPKNVWGDFLYECVTKGYDPVEAAVNLLNEARKLPNISHSNAENS